MSKIKVCVMFGGPSSEYSVSLVSANSILNNLDENKYEIITVGITEDGRWLFVDCDNKEILNDTWQNNPSVCPCVLSPDKTFGGFLKLNGNCFEKLSVDVIFPVMHGNMVEDGKIQGLFEMSGIPYVGCNTFSSANCMDKIATHIFLDVAGINNAKWLSFNTYDLKNGLIINKCENELSYPMFIKPANTGSSIGVSKAKNKDELESAIDTAFKFDNRIVVEASLSGKEVECAVLGNDDPIASICGEIEPAGDFYDYDAKYVNPQSKLFIPARITETALAKVRETAIKAYKLFSCSGLSRVDFFVDGEDVYLNEINTLPGFTTISMYPKLWDKTGIAYSDLLDKIIELALKRGAPYEK